MKDGDGGRGDGEVHTWGGGMVEWALYEKDTSRQGGDREEEGGGAGVQLR